MFFVLVELQYMKKPFLVGKVYASAFTRLSKNEDNSNYIVQNPKREVQDKMRELLNEITSELGLSRDILLTPLERLSTRMHLLEKPILKI